MDTVANREDPDEMPHNAAFHQGSALFAKTRLIFRKEIQYFFEITSCDSSIYTIWTLTSWRNRTIPLVLKGLT